MGGTNPLELADDDFLKLNSPPAVETPAEGEGEQDKGGEDTDPEDKQGDDAGDKGTDTPDDKTTDPEKDPDEGEENPEEGAGEKSKEGDNLQDKSKDKDAEKSEDGNKDEGEKPNSAAKTEDEKASPPDYQGFYEKIMSPLKANGKTIELKTPEDAIQLMQMGANYTRKMQALAPHRKILLMLENNKLLDEGKLSFLIDIEKKNPEAIKKLIKDSGIDPLEIDTETEPAYREGNHRVTDQEAGFRTVLDELSSNSEGRETLKLINTQWDQASKDILWEQPEVMALIHQQRDNGIYALITTELERQRTLGHVPATVPFLHAYKKIGDDLAKAGAFDHLAPKPEEKQPVVVATRKSTPKPEVKNGDKAGAAATVRSNSRTADTVVNPLALSDEDFMKEVSRFQGRV